MAANILEEFCVKIGALVDKKSFSDAGKAVDNTADKIRGMVKLAGGALAAGALSIALQKTADRFNALGDIASRVGTATASELDRLSYVAEFTGSSAEAAQASFESLSSTIGQAAKGIGRGAKVFEDFGLKAKNSDGSVKSLSQVIGEVQGKIQGLSRAEQVAYIQRLGMDKSLVGLLTSDTSEIIAEYDKRNKALGINVDEAAEQGAAFNDALRGMRKSFGDISTAFLVRIMPPITEAINQVGRWINSNLDLIRAFIDPLVKVFKVGAYLIQGFMKTVGELITRLGKLPLVVAGVAIAWKVLNTVFSASPLGKVIMLIGAVGTAIGLLMDDFETFKRGGRSFFNWQPFIDTIEKVKAGIATLSEVAKATFKRFENEINLYVGYVKGIFTGDWSGFLEAWEKLKAEYSEKLDGLKADFLAAWENVKTGFSTALSDMLKSFISWFDDVMNRIKNLGAEMKDAVKNKVSGAWDSVTNFLGFGNKGQDVTPDKNIAPATVANNQRTTNTTNTINQVFNVPSSDDASNISNKTIGRPAYGMAGLGY
jgi:phage-related protein